MEKKYHALEHCQLRACPRGSGRPRLGGVTNLSTQSLFFIDRVHMFSSWGTPASLNNPLSLGEFCWSEI